MEAGEESGANSKTPYLSGQRGASYQEVHHVWLVVPQCFDGVEDIHGSLVSQHLTDNADGTECTTAASSVPVTEEMRQLTMFGVALHLTHNLKPGERSKRGCTWPWYFTDFLYKGPSVGKFK